MYLPWYIMKLEIAHVGRIHLGLAMLVRCIFAQDKSETDGLQIAVPSFWVYERKVGHPDSAKCVVISDVSGVC